LLLSTTLCGGQTATEEQGHEYDRILELISNEDWKAASDAATSYLAKAGISEDLQARLRYIIIYATAGAVSTGRLLGRDHFTSDILVGSALGYVIGRYIFHLRCEPGLSESCHR